MIGTLNAEPRSRVVDPALVIVISLALLARLIVAVFGPRDVLSSTWEYEDVARNLIGGAGFVGSFDGTPYRALVHPLYPALCAAVYTLVGHPSLVAMQVVQSLAVVPLGWLAFDLGCTLGGRRAGVLAALGVTFHPALMIFSVRRHALWLDACIFFALFWMTYRVRAFAGTRYQVALGVLFGIAILSRSSIAVFMLFACAWLAWRWKTPPPVSLKRATLVVGIAALVAAPWLVRNALVFDRPVGFVSTAGQALWIGNNPAASGGALRADGTPVVYAADMRILKLTQGMSEIEQQDLYRAEALAFISSDPATAVLNYFRKIRIFLLWSDQTGAWYPAWFNMTYRIFYLALLACAVIGAIRLARTGRLDVVILAVAFVMSIGLLQSIFFVEGRHRWEVESALVVLAACGVASGRRDEEGGAWPFRN